jgi:hypothetical protein
VELLHVVAAYLGPGQTAVACTHIAYIDGVLERLGIGEQVLTPKPFRPGWFVSLFYDQNDKPFWFDYPFA